MNKEEMIRLFNKEQRIENNTPGMRREKAGPVIREVSLTGEDGFIIYSNLMGVNVGDVIQEQVAYFRELGQRFEWKVYDYDQPVDLKERLHAQGFEIGEPEALMMMQLNEENPLLTRAIPANIREITDAAGIGDIIVLEEAIWGEPHGDLGLRLKRDLNNDPEHLKIYACYADGKVVSAAWMYMHEGTSFGSLWGGSTLLDYRGQGIYTSLIAIRAQAAWHRGYRCLVVDASPMSRPILESKGFEFLAYSYPCMSPEA